MKLLAVLLLCLTLMGCGHRQISTLPTRLVPTKETENDILRCYPLDGTECRFLSFGEDLYRIQSRQTGTEIRRYQGKQLVEGEVRELPGEITAFSGGFVCYDPKERTLLLLDGALEESARFALPECTAAVPILNNTGDRVYYCTQRGLVEQDLKTGAVRLFREMPTRSTLLSGWLENQGILVCADESGENSYISTENGIRLGNSSQILDFCTVGSRDCLALRCGANDCLYLGSVLMPLVPGMHFLGFLPSLHSAAVYETGEKNQISLYDMGTGNRNAQISLPGKGTPIQAASSKDGRVFLLVKEENCEVLYQWMVKIQPQLDPTVHLTSVYTSEEPNWKGLEQCRQKARFLEEKYGFQILFHTAATQVRPRGCTLEAEHIPAVLLDTLNQMEQTLMQLPTAFVRETVKGNTRLCLVRSIKNKDDSLPCLQSWQGTSSYLFLPASENTGEALIQVLSPMIDRQVLTFCDAYDTWDAQNPAGDRASLLLAAVTPGNRNLFHTATLQNRLRQMCLGIRSVYDLGQSAPLWEQYLWQPM